MRHAISLALLLLLVAPSAILRADPPDPRPYEGFLPNREGAADEGVPYYAARIVDAVTGRPIEGAWLRGYEEDIGSRATAYAGMLGEARSDAEGVAWVPGFGEHRIDHWLVQADGYAPAYEYGYYPPPVVRLVRGVRARGRLVDPVGRPLADLELEVFHGCIHGPVSARVRTDAEGRFQLPAFDPEVMTRVWCTPPRGRARMLQPSTLAHHEASGAPTIFEAGRTVTGRVVDADGRGVADVVVRHYGHRPPEPGQDPGFLRGPTTRTDEDGRFVLAGLPGRPYGGLLVTPPGAADPYHWPLPDLAAPRLTLRVPPLPPAEDAPEGRLVMRAVHPGGGALPRLPAAYAVREDGHRERLAATPGFENPLPAGRWTVTPESAFLPTTFVPFVVEIPADEAIVRAVVVTRQPRTALVGAAAPLESLGQFELATLHESRSITVMELQDGLVPVPAVGDVVLWVGGRLFRFGPAADGVRRVAVEMPQPRTVRIVPTLDIEWVRVEVGGLEIDAVEVDELNRFETWLSGRITAVVETVEGWTWRVPLELSGPVREHVVELAAFGPGRMTEGPVHLTWRLADGTAPEGVRLRATDSEGGGGSLRVVGAESPKELTGPCRVVLRVPGYQTLERVLEPGAHEMVWGPHTLAVEAFGPDGGRVPSVVMVDGQCHRDTGREPFRLRGLQPGIHRVLVTPLDLRWRGVVTELELTRAETRLEVRFTPR